jgi:hypothetical protein
MLLSWEPLAKGYCGRIGCPVWSLGGQSGGHNDLIFFDPGEALPRGTTAWREYCKGRRDIEDGLTNWGDAVVTLTPVYDTGWCVTALAALAPALPAACCAPSDGPSCGAGGGLPAVCLLDCVAR